uniref:Uncharacterized protein n=1 Tax=Chromera velia CCMP2878 TaxID=1169474 RepID=A0A0G4HXP7_9ALVE|eukprot:Cvel_33221.t1-p1 / transcript=Cvel_33221.t1 / gene=Cvel_33221 / organism=Chromera_velia_CCMP2878 / gene_product=hypothetical protein / transcript_product=hypothetical protein / location=Cvel_scaffold5343:3205-4294(-) / protein_length=104 / sequence_SO=supercontig / SO=protein_coding / is_pseudo=false
MSRIAYFLCVYTDSYFVFGAAGKKWGMLRLQQQAGRGKERGEGREREEETLSQTNHDETATTVTVGSIGSPASRRLLSQLKLRGGCGCFASSACSVVVLFEHRC